eukprot:80273-Pyramimonas_sp.AAC.1
MLCLRGSAARQKCNRGPVAKRGFCNKRALLQRGICATDWPVAILADSENHEIDMYTNCAENHTDGYAGADTDKERESMLEGKISDNTRRNCTRLKNVF